MALGPEKDQLSPGCSEMLVEHWPLSSWTQDQPPEAEPLSPGEEGV